MTFVFFGGGGGGTDFEFMSILRFHGGEYCTMIAVIPRDLYSCEFRKLHYITS